MTTVKLPSIHVDNNYSELTLGALDLYFSYRTLVALRIGGKLYCQENQWGTTTGKHLNAIQPDKKKRLSASEFEQAYITNVSPYLTV